MSVVDNDLKVYGIDNLRIADGSIMPRVTTVHTVAPCVVNGDHAVDVLKAPYPCKPALRICANFHTSHCSLLAFTD